MLPNWWSSLLNAASSNQKRERPLHVFVGLVALVFASGVLWAPGALATILCFLGALVALTALLLIELARRRRPGSRPKRR